MKTLVLLAETQSTKDKDTDRMLWRDFADKQMPAMLPSKEVARIGTHVWQIPLTEGLRVLPQMVAAAKQAHVRIHIHVADELPIWVEMPS